MCEEWLWMASGKMRVKYLAVADIWIRLFPSLPSQFHPSRQLPGVASYFPKHYESSRHLQFKQFPLIAKSFCSYKVILKTSFQVWELNFVCSNFIFIAQTLLQKDFRYYFRMFFCHAILGDNSVFYVCLFVCLPCPQNVN